MREISLEEEKQIVYDILCYFDAFCRKNGIKYMIS